MTPAEFRQARESLGLTQAECAVIMNSDPRTIRKWESDDGTHPVNPIAARIMEWLSAGYVPPELERMRQ